MQISEIESVTTMAVLASICLLSLLISTPLKRNTISAERNPQGNPPRDDDDDEIDGDPVQSATAFWAQIHKRKLLLILLQSIELVIWGYSAFKKYTSRRDNIVLDGLHFYLSLTLLVIILRDQRNHSKSTILLSVLLTVQVFLMGFVTVYPGANTASNKVLWNADLALTILSWLVAVTTAKGPSLHYPEDRLYSGRTLASAKPFPDGNVSDEIGASLYTIFFFSYATKVFMLGRSRALVTLDQLPILPATLRAAVNFSEINQAVRRFTSIGRPSSGFRLAYQLVRANLFLVCMLQAIAALCAVLYYGPIFFIQQFLAYLEWDPDRKETAWGWFYVVGIFVSYFFLILMNAQMWSLASNDLRSRLSLQLNTLLYAKTLVRKDMPSSSNGPSNDDSGATNDFSSKAEVMTLMTTDVGRARDLSRLSFTLTDVVIGVAVGTYMLYNLLGTSSFVGLGIGIALVPLNQIAGKFVITYQQNAMECRDQRAAATNELLGAIRMIKFMAWERCFEQRVMKVRERELKNQKQIFWLETLWKSLGNSIPLLFALGSFWHFTVIRKEELTPAIAFTSIIIFAEIKYPLNELPIFLVQTLQAFVSLRRIEKYLHLAEIEPISDLHLYDEEVALRSATITWSQPRSPGGSGPTTPRRSFSLVDVSTTFPRGDISLVCGKIGSGKTLLLLGLLGEADILAGQVTCPRSESYSHDFTLKPTDPHDWVIHGVCAYVPQTPWLRNQTLKENILFNSPYDHVRYLAVLEACALVQDIAVLEDGDESEIGEQGINLSGGQKARVSLARAIYSRASTLLVDDVLSSVDTHTSRHLWDQCFKGQLMRSRTIIIVSHHVQLCGPDAAHIVALDNGHVEFSGLWNDFQGSKTIQSIVLSNPAETLTDEVLMVEDTDNGDLVKGPDENVSNDGDSNPDTVVLKEPKQAREETRFEGHISKDVWLLYIRSAGNIVYWIAFSVALGLASLSPVWESGWLRIWSNAEGSAERAVFYVGVYAAIVLLEIVIKIVRWLILFTGSIHASKVLFEKLLEAVLLANMRFHDVTSRGVILNRFGKDFEAVDNDLPNELGSTLVVGLQSVVTILSITYVSGWPFALASLVMITLGLYTSKIFGQVARDLRRLSSITSSPLFGIYGETISGLAVIRAFGMSSKFMKDMIIATDTNMNPLYWTIGINRWLTVRFQLSTGALTGMIAAIVLITPSIDAALAGLALGFATTMTLDMYWFIRRIVEVQQQMIALERIKEHSELPSEPPEFIEPRPPAAWPTSGSVKFEAITVRYAPDLPDVLHDLTLSIEPGEKIGLIGRTGSGKTTLGMSLLRFVEPKSGRILIDGYDISKVGITDLRRRLTVVPQDPMLLSGTLRTALDVLGEYDDAEIYEALRRVNLLKPPGAEDDQVAGTESSFSNLDTPVSELGDNFSTGEKQLLCMARALLRRSKILLMDEATASVDYATDEIISRTIQEEFLNSTVITIAHRLRTVIQYDRIAVLDAGKIVEMDKPRVLIKNERSKFYSLCKASGEAEFINLKRLAEGKRAERK